MANTKEDHRKADEARSVKVQDSAPTKGKTSEIGGEHKNEAKDLNQPKPGTTREEQPLPVPIFDKDGAPVELTVEKLWGGGEHKKAAEMCIENGANRTRLLKAFPQDEALIYETISVARRA